MPLVTIDVSQMIPPKLIASLRDPRAIVQRVLRDLATAAAVKWRKLAGQRLTASAGAYRQGIQEPVFVGPAKVRIILAGVIPNMIENGWSGGDQRQYLCGANAKNRKPIHGTRGEIVGWYNVIPFRHMGPGATGEYGQPIGSQYEERGALSRALPRIQLSAEALRSAVRSIRKEASGLTPTIGGVGQQTKWGGRLGERPELNMRPQLTPVYDRGGKLLGSSQHASDPFAGMVRQQETYEKATQSQYTTFRTISTQTSIGWYHPGITARHLAREVSTYVGSIAGRAFSSAARGAA